MKQLAITAVAVLAFAAGPASAEEQEPARKLQISPYVGAFIPTGDQRDDLDDAFISGLTVSYDVHEYVALVGSFTWAGTNGQDPVTGDQDVDVFTYDAGAQGQYPIALSDELRLKPFLGAGLGARTYDYEDVDRDSDAYLAGYVSAGANLEYRKYVGGLTIRNYVSKYDDDGDDHSSTRHDLAVFASVGVRF